MPVSATSQAAMAAPEGSFGLPFPVSYASVSLFDLSPEEAVVSLKNAGYAGIEWKVGDAPHAESSTAASPFLSDNRCTIEPGVADVGRLRTMARETGLAVVGLNPYLQVGDDAGLADMFEMAAAVGAPQIRFQAPRLGSGQEDYAQLLTRTQEHVAHAGELARAADVRFVLEMHHRTIAPSAELAMRAIAGADPDHVGVILDIGNTVWEGHADIRIALEILGPHLHHVHLKNVRAKRTESGRWVYEWSVLDEGFLDVRDFLIRLYEHGYTGWVSVEDLSTVRSPAAAMLYNAVVLSRISVM